LRAVHPLTRHRFDRAKRSCSTRSSLSSRDSRMSDPAVRASAPVRWLKERGSPPSSRPSAERPRSRATPGRVCGDCVIMLDHRVTSRSRRGAHGSEVRGSRHETNEFPSSSETMDLLVPVTSMALTTMSPWRASPQDFRLDKMLGGKDITAGAPSWSPDARDGKTSIASTFADAACRRGAVPLRRFEEGGADLPEHAFDRDRPGAWVAKGFFACTRPPYGCGS